MKLKFEDNRPEGFSGKFDKLLPALVNSLEKYIAAIQLKYKNDTLKLDKEEQRTLAWLLIEFAEDLHNDIGLWKSIEYYNLQLFYTPLPLFVKNENEITEVFDVNRIKYFIYTIFAEINSELVLAPKHSDLNLLAINIAGFFNRNFNTVPKDSGVKKFLSQPNTYGWEFKKKLVWTGMNSYLFSLSALSYVEENNKGKMEIPVIDDFICAQNTIWSGLGVIDVLAQSVQIPENLKKDVRSWYERYMAYFRVVSFKGKIMTAENLVNSTIYEIYSEMGEKFFKIGSIILGAIVHYGEYWYWSGTQHILGIITDKKKLNEIVKDFRRNTTRIIYRYDKQLVNRARKDVKRHYAEFIDFFGDDLVAFDDGLSMAAALQKKDRIIIESKPKKEVEAFMKRHGRKDPFPQMNFPKSILDADNGVAVFFNQNEGSEILLSFNDVRNGFSKNGDKLTYDEEEAIRGTIESPAISPAFVYRLIKDYDHKSIQAAYLLNTQENDTDYLLHKYKGHFFRNKYPEISYVD